MWIRSSWWDGSWLLSGLPCGVIFALAVWAGVPIPMIIFWCVLVAQTGHLLSPTVLAWSHKGFRAHMLRHRVKFIGVPLGVLAAATYAGYIGSLTLPNIHFDPVRFSLNSGADSLAGLANPFMAMVLLYALWNGWHFGKQNFGVMSLYRRRAAGRRADLWYCCGVTWAAMLMPFIPKFAQELHALTGFPAHPHPFLDFVQPAYLGIAMALIPAMLWREWRSTRSLPRAILILTDGLGLVLIWFGGLWGFALIGLNHWLTAVGLASRYSGRPPWLFALGLLAAGFALFAALFVRPEPYFESWHWALAFTVPAVGFRLGLGFVHFLYDRWVYKTQGAILRNT